MLLFLMLVVSVSAWFRARDVLVGAKASAEVKLAKWATAISKQSSRLSARVGNLTRRLTATSAHGKYDDSKYDGIEGGEGGSLEGGMVVESDMKLSES